MGDKDKSKISSSEMDNLSSDTSRYSRDLLTRFMGSSSSSSGQREGQFRAIKEEGEEEIELNLGLSLGGRLGVDKGSMKLIRSSSIAECLPIVKDEDDPLTSSSPPAVSYSRLVRTTSLPLGSDEELRKRKEMQTLRRMEAKKRRSEKQKRNLKGEKEEEGSGGVEKDEVLEASKLINSRVEPPFQAAISSVGIAKGKAMQEFIQQGSSPKVDNLSLQRTGSCGDTSPGNVQSSLQDSNNQEVGCSSSLVVENTSTSNETREKRANAIEEMPCVFTKGDGPNGRRVDGILYKYGRGEEVRIMCICHGTFHSPAEFVKHAGGIDITHPLKHIVVNPNSTPFN